MKSAKPLVKAGYYIGFAAFMYLIALPIGLLALPILLPWAGWNQWRNGELSVGEFVIGALLLGAVSFVMWASIWPWVT